MKNLIFVIGVFMFCLFSCDNNTREQKVIDIKKYDQNTTSLNSFPEKYFFKGKFKDWVQLRGDFINDMYPIEIIEKSQKDTINDIFIEYGLGNYYFVSFKFPIKVIVPLLFGEEVETYFDNQLPELVYKAYKRKYLEQSHFFKEIGGEGYLLKTYFKLIDEKTKTYQVFHEEVFQPNFETTSVITGRRIFTISFKKGIIEYELEGKFKKVWY